MDQGVRKLFFFAQLGLLTLLIAMIVLGRPSWELLVVCSLALLSGIAGAIGKTIQAAHRQNLTLILEDTSMPRIQLAESEVGQSMSAPVPKPETGRRKTVTLRRKPNTDMILAIDDALGDVEAAASGAHLRGEG